jgi:hypothetical protein
VIARHLTRAILLNLEMWERAYGVPATSCRSAQDTFAAGGTSSLRLGTSAQSLLYALGQPTSRPFYGVSAGRVRYVGVAARSELARREALRSDLHAAGVI